ncbi:MAG: hypothetical protein A2452_05405 [Candidatus Firestonebacteria bacterium RIFOXYC2_FULL_39_67]|nr:MAG: hypothetical protein A2536_10235 [Candidatus Firestonebacteria bacterium RIFOXYD2_FULL_39_29]OGF52540.1 MAG: hypothetical protein A2497_02015 [Candidatus Firestonebacteria bacterium RifOxyC12_full_39_7]OGF56376.1 MAG: hypothetical protein A2452_05405 [Candidatus Firestonebacteria bacterium RIFOXYC2_FULL_39_67]
MKIRQKIKVEFDYNIYFTGDMFSSGGRILKEIFKDKNSRIMVFIDSAVSLEYPEVEKKLRLWFKNNPERGEYVIPRVKIKGGEWCKNDKKLQGRVARLLRDNSLDRHSFVVIIGGGAVLDTVGYFASITHRGLRQIRIPTTVLSQCDSGVGVKNGINYYGTKNYFGTFTPPFAVINDFNFLQTLGTRDILSGAAEAFKVAIIKDRKFLNFLVNNSERFLKGDRKAIKKMIFTSARLHAEHISTGQDPFETGSSRPLDFGHWSGHFIEVLTKYELRHGEAVALGVVLDMIIAKNLKLISAKEFTRVYNGLKNCGFNLWHPVMERRDRNGILSIYRGLEEFRQHIGGELHLVMPDRLGKKCVIKSLPHDEIEKAVREMKNENKK